MQPVSHPAPPLVLSVSFEVRAYEVGPDGAASPLALCDYLQEAAGHHARALGVEFPALPAGAGTWVLARLRLHVERLPAHGETVGVETWPSAHDGLRAERDFVVRTADGRPVARASSEWLVIDPARRRPARLPTDVRALRLPERPRALPPEPEPAAPAAPDAASTFAVRRSDLDRVGHANNVRFVEWALEAVPDAHFAAHTLARLDVRYRAEAVRGTVVRVEGGPGAEPGALAHHLRRDADGATLALARSLWTPREGP
jgi:medium-chain acyl-[acyl-carrier-protein] hydrolase